MYIEYIWTIDVVQQVILEDVLLQEDLVLRVEGLHEEDPL
jgi:hypothetical protein